jgi:hypothetical protein
MDCIQWVQWNLYYAFNIILIKMNIIHPYINATRYKNTYTLDASRLEIAMRKLVPK